jgi:hypothetical protein
MQFLSWHELVAQDQIFNLVVNASGKIFDGARFCFGIVEAIGHWIILHKKIYAMLRTVSDPLNVVNEGSLRLEKTTGNDKESCDLGS